MKDRQKIILGITTILATVSIAVYLVSKNKKIKRNVQLDRIAEEGYETAGDVLYPISSRAARKSRASWNKEVNY